MKTFRCKNNTNLFLLLRRIKTGKIVKYVKSNGLTSSPPSWVTYISKTVRTIVRSTKAPRDSDSSRCVFVLTTCVFIWTYLTTLVAFFKLFRTIRFILSPVRSENYDFTYKNLAIVNGVRIKREIYLNYWLCLNDGWPLNTPIQMGLNITSARHFTSGSLIHFVYNKLIVRFGLTCRVLQFYSAYL